MKFKHPKMNRDYFFELAENLDLTSLVLFEEVDEWKLRKTIFNK